MSDRPLVGASMQPCQLGITRRSALRFAAAAGVTYGALSLPLTARAVLSVSRPKVEPGAGAWRTWFLGRGSDLRLPPPPDGRDEVSQVRGMVGSVDAALLDRIAFWDAGAPPYRWNEIATEMMFRGAFGTGNGSLATAWGR
jgi:hypothetical protein